MSQNHLITQQGLFENSKKEIESQEREIYSRSQEKDAQSESCRDKPGLRGEDVL